MKLQHHCYESGWTANRGHDFPESITTNCVKSKRLVYIYILFLAFLLKLCCCEDHVYCLSVFSESTLTFWDKSLLIKMNIQAMQQNFFSIFTAMNRRDMPQWLSQTCGFPFRLYGWIMRASLNSCGIASFLHIQ